ncbi:hypothetical protein CR513_40637, partial [Mucuna pruriens]
MESTVGKSYLFLPTTKDVWEAAKHDYQYVITHYNLMKTLWQELDQCYEDDWKIPKMLLNLGKERSVYMFLAGLNRSLDKLRGRILRRTPLPSIRQVFSEVRQEESRKRIMLNTHEPSIFMNLKVQHFVTRGISFKDDKGKKSWCDHFKKPCHMRKTCWKIHGKPLNWKKKRYLSYYYSLYTQKIQNPWIIDFGATNHMTNCSKLFCSYSPCAGNKKIRTVDGTLSTIARSGSIPLSPLIILHDVFHVPNLSCNLLSISKLTHDMNCCELTSERMIDNAKEVDGPYIFEDRPTLIGQTHSICFNSISRSQDNEIMLWHYSLSNSRYKSSSPFIIIHSNVWCLSRSLVFPNYSSYMLLGEAILTTTYLINRMPSKVLKFKTPRGMFLNHFPTNRLSSNLALKIFGSTTFTHINTLNQSKLDP